MIECEMVGFFEQSAWSRMVRANCVSSDKFRYQIVSEIRGDFQFYLTYVRFAGPSFRQTSPSSIVHRGQRPVWQS